MSKKKKDKPSKKDRIGLVAFEPGTVVVFDPKLVHEWHAMSEEDRIKYFGDVGYGSDKPIFFVYMCEIRNAPGHCVLISLQDQKIVTMIHATYFREVEEEEF